jgi:hypothetical protein
VASDRKIAANRKNAKNSTVQNRAPVSEEAVAMHSAMGWPSILALIQLSPSKSND